jgi:hypothetical protein
VTEFLFNDSSDRSSVANEDLRAARACQDYPSERDVKAAHRFLFRLGSHTRADRFTFQTFDEKPSKRKALSRVWHGTFQELSVKLAALNDQGAGVFVMVNEGDGKGRTAENVLRIRTLMLDLDGADLQPVLSCSLQPHMVVETSPGRWHVYWLVDDVSVKEFPRLQKALAQRFNGDATICDSSRVMRIPGFLHQKGTPFPAKLLQDNDQPAYKRDAVVSELGLTTLLGPAPARTARAAKVEKSFERKHSTLTEVIKEGERNSKLFDLGVGLARSGHGQNTVRRRLHLINSERCRPPLSAEEIARIAKSASSYVPSGFCCISHKLQDSPAWKSLPAPAKVIVLGAFRLYNGYNNGKLVLDHEYFEDQAGLHRSATFYKQRRQAVRAGFLIETEKARWTQTRKLPSRFAIPEVYLHQPMETNSALVSLAIN